MNKKLFVGNLDYSTMEHQLRSTFEAYGQVASATVVLDRMTGQSRGFGFVEFDNADDAQRAVDSLNGSTLNGRSLNVSLARERTGGGGRDGGGGAGRGGGRGGFSGGGGGGGKRRRDGGSDRW